LSVNPTDQTLSCAAKAHVPKSRGTTVAARAADVTPAFLRSAEALQRRTKPGRISFSI
jgi:hypothetical protein